MSSLPTMQIFLDVVKNNYISAKKKCDSLGIELRPHVKTLQDPVLCNHLRALGLTKICVSNMDMLKTFLDAGWYDICLAIPCSPTWISDINHYLENDALNLILYVDHLDQLRALDQLKKPVQIMIEIDAGQTRSGVHWKHEDNIKDLIQGVHDSVHFFYGLSAHFGHHYLCHTKQDIIDNMAFSMMRVLQLKEHLQESFGQPISLAIGDTPSFLAMDYFDQVNEIRAGNFFLNDLTIYNQGLCDFHQIGCSVVATVIGKFESDLRLIVHVGSIHLSKERHPNDDIGYGLIGTFEDDGLPEFIEGATVTELYQEHAVCEVPISFIEHVAIGDSLTIFPVHSCLAMDAMVHKKKFSIVE